MRENEEFYECRDREKNVNNFVIAFRGSGVEKNCN